MGLNAREEVSVLRGIEQGKLGYEIGLVLREESKE